jgi:hypothetical protein
MTMQSEAEILKDIMASETEVEDGETVELDDDSGDVVENDDGSAVVKLDDEGGAEDNEFYANLAETLPMRELQSISVELDDLISRDRKAREKRDEKYEEGIRRTGLGDDAPGGASFEGASKVVHPMLVEACIDFAARAIKELFPPGGPAKDNIIGEVTAEKTAKSKRKTKFLNWQFTQQMPEFRAELEQMLTQVPMGGVQYLKLTWDAHKRRPTGEFVAVDDVFLPFAATNFYASNRKTHRQYLTRYEYERRVRTGMYLDADLPRIPIEPDVSRTETANQRVEGKEASAYNEDGLREVLEISVSYEITDTKRKSAPPERNVISEQGPAPYLITMDSSSKRILAVYRNWEEQDETEEELIWMIEFPFVPWRGAYAIGLPHMIGGLAAGATGALRALLDSALIANFPGMLKLKGQVGGQTVRVDAQTVTEIDGGINVDDIRKIAMPVPTNQPSAVLFQLLGFLVDAGKGVVKTTLDEANDNQNVPVGTMMARIEQGMVVFSSIHARLHDAMGRVLKVVHRINATYLDDDDVKKQTGEQLASRKDFEDPLDVIPVSDPNIFSEMQRFAQVQTIAQRAATLPQLYDLRKVEEAILERMRIPNPSSFLIAKPEPVEMNAVNENVAAAMGRPIVAFPAQDHLAHLQAHLDFLGNPMFGMNPIIAQKFIPAMLQHTAEHMTLWYATQVHQITSSAAETDIGQFAKSKDPAVRAKFDTVLAAAAQKVNQQAGEAFKGVPPVLQQAMQAMAKLSPPSMGDPTQASAAASQAETQRKTAADQQNMQAKVVDLKDRQQARAEAAQQKQVEDAQKSQEKQAEMQFKAQENATKTQADLAKEQGRQQTQKEIAALGASTQGQVAAGHDQTSQQNTQTNADVKLQTNDDDNRTAMQIAAAEIEQDGKTNLSTGTSIGE